MKAKIPHPDLPPEMSLQDFRTRFGVRESGISEFKESLPKAGKLQEPLVAFRNSRGGCVVIGASKTSPVKPVDLVWGQRQEEGVQEAARAVQPPLDVDVGVVRVDGAPMAVIQVAPTSAWAQTSDGRVIVRAGPTNRTLFGSELARFLRERSTDPVEDTVVPKAGMGDLRNDLVRTYLPARLPGRKNVKVEAALRDLGFVTPDGEVLLATVLLFAKDPQKFHRRFGIVISRFEGKLGGGAKLRQREQLTGPMPELVQAADEKLYELMRREAVIRGLVREEVPEFPSLVVREALVNAVGHRDYALDGAAIEVRLYDDALEVESPGTLAGYVTLENLRDAQYSRNDRIMGVLERLGLVEEAGQGIDRMFDAMEEALLEPPEFEERDRSFVVRLRGTSVFAAEDRVWVSKFRGLTLDPNAKVALVYARRNGSIKNEELRTLRNLDRESSRALLRDLVGRGLLEKVGHRGGTRYVMGPVALEAPRQLSLDDRLMTILSHARRQGGVTNAVVRGLLGVDARVARNMLRELVSRGDLRAVGEKRGRRYVPTGTAQK